MSDIPKENFDYKAHYDSQGFVILPSLLSTTACAELQVAAERVIARTRQGEWPYRRTVGKQFPPFDESNPDSWGVQHIMHPDLHEPAFVNWYTSDFVIGTVATLLACEEEDLQMGGCILLSLYPARTDSGCKELFNMLINPESHDFALRWHRDDVREDATEEEEREALAKWHYGVSLCQQYSTPQRPGHFVCSLIALLDTVEYVRTGSSSQMCGL